MRAEAEPEGRLSVSEELGHPEEDGQELVPADTDRLGRMEAMLSQVLEENKQLKGRLEATEVTQDLCLYLCPHQCLRQTRWLLLSLR